VRAVVLLVCAAGVVGMIVASVVGSNGAALTFGLITAAAVACSMVATAVGTASRTGEVDEEWAATVEGLVTRLVAQGADEKLVRQLVRAAAHLHDRPRSDA
jgi:hypothetical protein